MKACHVIVKKYLEKGYPVSVDTAELKDNTAVSKKVIDLEALISTLASLGAASKMLEYLQEHGYSEEDEMFNRIYKCLYERKEIERMYGTNPGKTEKQLREIIE